MILVDEHPLTLKDMSIDTPYFYGVGLSNIPLIESRTWRGFFTVHAGIGGAQKVGT